MVGKKILDGIKELYESGIDAESIAEQYDLDITEVQNILNSFDEEDNEDGKSKKDNIDERMDKNAEGSITGEVIKRTKGLALDIQKTKEEIGDFIYHMFDNTGLPIENIASFVEEGMVFFIENYKDIDNLKKELETAEDMIEKLWEVADEHSSKERIVKEYVLKCATEGTPVDNDFVQKML
jgi:hypothetical protein